MNSRIRGWQARFVPTSAYVSTRRSAKIFTRTAVLGAFLSVLGLPETAHADVGPGLGNLDCGDAEYFKPFAFVENATGPKGTNVSVMIRGYFMTIFAPDSGRPPGEMGIYDVSNPKTPRLVKHMRGGDLDAFREAHSLPIAIIGDKQYIAIQTIRGIQFWDFTDPADPRRVGNIDLPGVNGGDYENASWQTSWQGRYLYVAGGNQGIYVVDAQDPTSPKLLSQIRTSSTGGFRVGPLFALGDYLVISNMDQGGAYAVLDITKPAEPALLSRIGNLPRIYAIVVGANDRIFAAGRDGNFLNHSFSNPTNISLVKNALIGQDQLYAATQDHFVYLGRQNNVVKVDMTDEQNPRVVGEGTLGRANPDHGQVTPLGNLIFIGNDHGTGSAFFCHQRGKDTIPLEVQSTYPKSDSTGVDPGSRISLLFSDYVDLETVLPENIVVRVAGGDPVPGMFTYTFNTLSFGPNEPFASDTTYEVVVNEGGLTDIMGNAIAEEHILRFSTGDMVVVPPPEEPEPPATGGADGSGGDATVGAGGGFVGTGGSFSAAGGAVGAGGAPLPGTGGAVGVGGGVPGMTGGTAGEPPLTDDSSAAGGCSLGRGASAPAGLSWGLLGMALFALRRSVRRT